MTQPTYAPPPTQRRNTGIHDALADRQRGRFPMPLLQQRWPAHQRTYVAVEAAKRHFDRAYAKGYVIGYRTPSAWSADNYPTGAALCKALNALAHDTE